MPPRLARSSVQTAAPKTARNKNKKRNLNAYAIASHSAPSKNKVKQHRLGEYLDDRPPPKRRRDSEDDDVAALDEEDVRGAAKKRKTAVDDDDVEQGSDSEGNEWTLGGLAEDDEDSDLDSEEAFGESDEEKFEGFKFGGSSGGRAGKGKSGRRGAEHGQRSGVNLDEGENEDPIGDDEDEDDFGDEGVDLATMLDDEDEEQAEEGGDDESEDDEDRSSSESASDGNEADGVDDEERNARMMDRLEALDGEQQAEPKQSAQQNSLSVEDLLADLDPAAKKQFAAATKTKKRSERPTTLAAPLPKRQQDRLNREVASKKAKEQLDRWRDTVIQNRRAEFLSFPLKDPNQSEPQGKDKFVESKPRNELEENIQRIMEESGMAAKDGHEGAEDGEDAIMKAEGMEEKKMDVDEVMRRRAELRKARELLFREEKKAKRIAKIKSKSYRRVHRKEKARQSEREREEREMRGLEPTDEDEKEKQDRRRAEERMSTKHRDSKWAKQLKQTNRAAWDEGARDSVNEEARRREELRRRVEGQAEGSDDSDGSFDDDDGSDDGDAVTLRQLEGLQDETNGKEKGLANMKFMRDADARRKAQNDEDVERLRKEFAIEDGDEAESGNEIDDQGLGRAIFGPQGRHGSGKEQVKKKEKRPEMEEGSESEPEDGEQEGQDEDVEIFTEKKGQTGDKNQQKTKVNGAKSGVRPNGSQKQMRQSSEDPDSGPSWVAKGAKKTKKAQSSDEIPPPRQNSRSARAEAGKADDCQFSRPDAPPFLQELQQKSAASKDVDAGNTDGWTLVKYPNNNGDDNDGSDSDVEPPNPILTRTQQNANLQSRAFAGDDFDAQFAAEKHAAESSEDEKETSSHLPGWGSWTGEGLSKSVKKANAKQKHNPLFKHKTPGGVKRSERQDKALPNVIVSEKKDGMKSGKGGKYLAGTLPRGFGGKEEYERSLRRPVGEEWGTKEVVQRNVKPRVVTKRGVAIEAMEKPMV